MSMPYGVDYVKRIVSQSLSGSGGGGTNADENESESESEDGANAVSGNPYGVQLPQSQENQMPAYGVPPQGYSMPPEAVMYMNQTPENTGMGPRYNALTQSPLMQKAASMYAPVGGAIANALSTAGIDGRTLAQGLSNWASADPKQRDFTNSSAPANINEYLGRLAAFESGRNPTAYNKASSASGAFQYTDPTWKNYGGYASARDAPIDIQYKRALDDTVNRLKYNNGDIVKATLTHFLGARGMQNAIANPAKFYQPVNAANGKVTPFSYAASILGAQTVQDWATKNFTAAGNRSSLAQAQYNLPANG